MYSLLLIRSKKASLQWFCKDSIFFAKVQFLSIVGAYRVYTILVCADCCSPLFVVIIMRAMYIPSATLLPLFELKSHSVAGMAYEPATTAGAKCLTKCPIISYISISMDCIWLGWLCSILSVVLVEAGLG